MQVVDGRWLLRARSYSQERRRRGLSNGPQRVERVTRGKIWIEFGLRAIQILSRPDIEIPLFPTNRSPIAIQPCAGSGGVPKVPSVRAKGGGEFAFSLVGHSKPTPTSQPAPLRLAACSPYKSQPSPHLGRQGALPEARGVSTTMCGGYGAPPRSHTPIHRPTRATTTPATHVGGELQCPLGSRARSVCVIRLASCSAVRRSRVS